MPLLLICYDPPSSILTANPMGATVATASRSQVLNMDVGIGLPNTVKAVDRAGIVDGARAAEAAGFASLGTIEHLSGGAARARPGGREDDYALGGVDFRARGRLFDRQLEDLGRF